MVLLLLAHFDEKEEHMLHFIEKTSIAEDVQMENAPPTTCLFVCGKYVEPSLQAFSTSIQKLISTLLSTSITF